MAVDKKGPSGPPLVRLLSLFMARRTRVGVK
jgi:hypothetical protein